MRYFYNHSSLITAIDQQNNYSLFRLGHFQLAQKIEDSTYLLCTDSQASPVTSFTSAARENLAFSPYGWKGLPCYLGGFKGEHLNPESGNYLLGQGHRSYSPSLARFLNPDALSPFGKGGINTYTYVLNDPVNGSDPSGQMLQFMNSAFDMMRDMFGTLLKTILWPITKEAYHGKILMGGDDFTVFSSDGASHGSSTLYIDAHGSPGYLYKGKRAWTGERVIKKIKSKGISIKGRNLHALSCNSATPDPETGLSIIDGMARFADGDVEGYDDFIYTFSFAKKNSGKVDMIKIYVPPFLKGVSEPTKAKAIRGRR